MDFNGVDTAAYGRGPMRGGRAGRYSGPRLQNQHYWPNEPQQAWGGGRGGLALPGRPHQEICNYFLNGTCKFGNSCKNWHDAEQRDARARFADYGGRKLYAGERNAVDDHMESINESKSHIWMPTSLELQLRRLGSEYWLMFPLELTNKDYLRRILEVVAAGISERVVSASTSLHHSDVNNGVADPFPVYSEEHSRFDAQYLLKHITGQCHPIDKKLRIQQALASALPCNYETLATSAGLLLESWSDLFYTARGGLDDTGVTVHFTAAAELLRCFGVSAATTLAQLNDLRRQYNDHTQFKKSRCAALGWERYLSASPQVDGGSVDGDGVDGSIPVPPSSALVANSAFAEKLEERAQHLIASSALYLSPTARAKTQAICILQGQATHLNDLCTAAASRAEYDEASRLDALQELVEASITRCEANAWFGELNKLLCLSDALILDIVRAENGQKSARQFAEAARLHDVYGHVKASKDALKQSWGKIDCRSALPEGGGSRSVTPQHLLYHWGRGAKPAGCTETIQSLFGAVHRARLEEVMIDICNSWLQGSRTFCADALTPPDHWSVAARRTGGFTVDELSPLYNLRELADAGYSATELKDAGYSLAEVRDAGYSAKDLWDAGY